ncbi:lipoprotein [Spiroplasma taiwanense]|uniref:Lipoprotein n=1 Tax=Spiroplasma taiwanense CT-1 TaxID=1276220 RepID=S5MHX8_9MOLU|nr:lipoprotein [Spiroplasma taiwanense]AGR41495.1 hypothetical protein STAIW_v1c09090 [Spiroplasma taiwanense CT-1]
MKKLLTLLGSISIIATTGQMVVACATDYDQKDQDGNSILIQFLKKLDGVAEIKTSDILWKLINAENGPKNREKLTLELMQMINLSILSNAKNNYVDGNGKYVLDDSYPYNNYDLANTLVSRWDTLSKNVDRQIENEKKKYEKDYGKKWESEWDKMLLNKYTIYQEDTDDMDRNFLEAKYKADILLTDSSNNASKTLLDVLINTDQQGVTWVDQNTIKTKYLKLKAYVANTEANADLIAYIRSDIDQLSQIYNSTIEDSSAWENKAKSSDTDEVLIATAKEVTGKDIAGENGENILYDAPSNIDEFTISDSTSRSGFLSSSQRFFVDKWYNVQAPLAISEITIGFSENGKFDDGITEADFKSAVGDTDQKNTFDLLAEIKNDTENKSWKTYMAGGTLKHPKATVKQYEKLLTLNNSTDFTQDLRTVVYDYVLGEAADKNINENVQKIEITGDAKEFINKLIPEINRTKNEEKKFYGALKVGTLIYIDSTGIHIVNIDGYGFLKESESANKELTGQKGIEDDKVNSETLKELSTFKKYSKLTDEQKVYKMQTTVNKDVKTTSDSQDEDTESNLQKADSGIGANTYFSEMNSKVTNPYLHYLVNTSLVKGLKGASTSFDILSEVKSWAQISSSSSDSSSAYWMTCVFDYFKEISKPKSGNEEIDQNEFIKQFIEFNTDSETNGELATSTQSWFFNGLKTKQDWTNIQPSISFAQANKSWVDTIKSQTDASGYPKAIIENSWYKNDLISRSQNYFWKPTKSTRLLLNSSMEFNNNLDLNKLSLRIFDEIEYGLFFKTNKEVK